MRSSRPRLPVLLALVVLAATVTGLGSGAAAAGSGPVKPDFCFAINPGGADVEITFNPSKLNIGNPGADNADHYRLERNDGTTWIVGVDDNKTIHDLTSAGTVHTYDVFTVTAAGVDSNPQPCIGYTVVSSIATGPLQDWRRPADVIHGLGHGPIGGPRTFTGADNDIVTTDVALAESASLNPSGDQFVFQADVTLSTSDMVALMAADGPSWNVMQRGLAGAQGGQWKMSIVTAGNPKLPKAQCVAKDAQNKRLQVNSTYVLQAGEKATISCVVDDEANTLRIIVNGRTDAPDTEAGFGDINPHSNGNPTCWQTTAEQISVGNKPLCGTLTDDDRFRGSIKLARILKGV